MEIQQQTFHQVALLVHCFQVELEYGILVFMEGGKPEFKLQQTQPTCNIRSGNQTQATAVGGKHSQQCAIPTSKFLLFDYYFKVTMIFLTLGENQRIKFLLFDYYFKVTMIFLTLGENQRIKTHLHLSIQSIQMNQHTVCVIRYETVL